jgi:hypothetical protein
MAFRNDEKGWIASRFRYVTAWQAFLAMTTEERRDNSVAFYLYKC